MIRSENFGQLVAALHKAQLEFPAVKRDTVNPHFHSKYATLDGAIEVLQPVLDKYGLTVFQPPCSDPDHGYTGITTILFHESGEYFGDTLLLPNAAPGGDKGGAQSATAAVTYSRRTAYLATLGVAPEDDDDGNKSDGRREPPARNTQAPQRAAAGASTKTQTAPPTSNSAPAASTTSKPAQAASTAAVDPALLPTEAEMDGYRKRFSKLSDELKDKGGLKANGLPRNRKIHNFLLEVTGSPDANHITKSQWDDFFQRADHVTGLDNGWVGLAKLVNKANKIEDTK